MVLLVTLFICSFAVGYGAADVEPCVTKQEFESAMGKLGKEMTGMRELNDIMMKRIFELELENVETKNRLSDLQNEFKKQITDRPIEKTRFPAGKLHPFAEPIWQQNIQRNQTPESIEFDHDKSPGILEVLTDNGIPKHDRSSGKPGIRSGRSAALTQPHRLLGRQTGENTAFSLFVTQDITNLGKDQIIKYQGILINDGNGYDVNTGIFTAPRSGLYLFAVFVEDYHDQDLWVALRQDGKIRTQAVAEPYAEHQNIQGGNVVLLHVNQGSRLWISIAKGNRIQQSWSTFSGILLY